MKRNRTALIATGIGIAAFTPATGDDTVRLAGDWKLRPGETVSAIYEIRGTEGRQNPLRRKLDKPFIGDELFVRFRIRYDAGTIDQPPDDEGEFFVLWLDAVEGNDASTHSGGVPNLGIHVKDGKANHFMARFASSLESYGPELKGDREFLVVGRLSKSKPGTDRPFDFLDMWIDPKPEALSKPDASRRGVRGIASVNWIGFSTGGKTEPEDRIQVRDLALATSWEAILEKPAALKLTAIEIPSPPPYRPPSPPAELEEVDPPPDSIDTDHWSFQAITRPEIPMPKNSGWVRNPIDAFVARKHEAQGLSPSPAADPPALARRMSLVVTGLPPAETETPGNLDDYADSLLASSQFGERWARHWLDLARWAESNGHQHNRDRKHAWRYRDWVVNAINEDIPYDAFMRAQIAGDEIAPFDSDNIIATGFLAAARYSGNELDKAIQRNDILVDIVNTTAKTFLGLTMECAQCHDHFFDPLTQWDYYRMMAFFVKGQPGDIVLDGDAVELVQQRWGLFEAVRSRMIENKRAQGLPEPVLVLPKSVPGGMSPEEKARFNAIEKEIATSPQAWAFYSPVTSPHRLAVAPTDIRWPLPQQPDALEHQEVRFLVRGDTNAPGPIVDPAWPQVFEVGSKEIGDHPRLAFANWLADPKNPLTARVWVNRIWQGYFGRGLVETSGDLGVAGSKPSHPELLDWLASELIKSGWSSKHIHRLTLQSNTFRQSSLFSASNAGRDPGNAALWRWKPRRLEAEAIRDSVLTVSGVLDAKAGGSSVPRSEAETSRRRSLYLQQKRDNLPHQQMLFDSANAVTSCARRTTSTVSLQPLWMLNSEFMQNMARLLAKRAAIDADSTRARTARLIELAYGRKAEADEVAALEKVAVESGLEDAAGAILNTNEFLYIP